ncbi:MAG: restriction endonuclease subunit S [Proteobacteria bacterium]|nr:restriction endonuclease subunit S [Pseudomonadota bacterium]
MVGEWTTAKIEDVSEKVAMGPFGSSIKVETFVPHGIPVISGQHLHGSRLMDTDYNFVSLKHAEKLKNANVYRGDVVFTHAGNIGQVAFIPASSRYERYVISQRQFYLRPNLRKVLPEFIAYYFTSAEGQHKLLANTSSGVPSIAQPVSYLRTIEIPLPPLSEQRAIAHILGTLDDKIELNRKMNRTLEAMAQAIFKSWFVDFDPVRAKAEGRDPGLPKAIADLFPDAFEDSELGEIPEGWEVGTLGEVAVHPRRGVQPAQIEPDTPYIALEHMPRRCIALSDWGTAEGLESNKFKFNAGEILFGKLRPYFHKVGVAPVDGVCSTDIVVVAPRSSHWFGFVLGHVSSIPFVEYTNASSTGTKMPRTSWNDMARCQVVIPPKPLAEAFTNQINQTVDRIISSVHEFRTIAALRDTLLPKLISGELSLPDAEQIIGRCV